MTKIATRKNVDTDVIARLQNSLTSFSMGAVTKDGSGVVKVGADLGTLATQVDSVLQSMLQTLEGMAVDLSIERAENTQLSLKVDELESVVENLLGDVSFDEALDHATADLMDCLASSGSADITADGELAFDERITLSKEDLKPYLQQAITRWIERRLEG